MKNRFLCTVFLCVLFFSCKRTSSPLDRALELAESNRTELERVLSHYSQFPQDSLKYRAACFLIENMPGHYSYQDTTYYASFYATVDSLLSADRHFEHWERERRFREFLDARRERPYEIVPDVQMVTADYLIDNIERSFKVWTECEWAHHLDFDRFCEYILPYKIKECQHLDNWREYFETYCDGELRSLQYCDLWRKSAFMACETVCRALDEIHDVHYVTSYDVVAGKMGQIKDLPIASCDDYNFLGISVMRAKGIPCTIDFTPQWPFRSLGHSWCVLLKNTGKTAIFDGIAGRPGLPHKDDHKMAKVFRYRYRINEELQELNNVQESVPGQFQELYIGDVTGEYMDAVDVELSPGRAALRGNRYGYLAVWDNQNWTPVHWGKARGGNITFKQMGKDVLYMPVLYNRGWQKAFDRPFILSETGKMTTLVPDTAHKQTLVLNRKFPPFPSIYDCGGRAIGGRFEAANMPDFSDADTLFTVTEFGLAAGEIDLDTLHTPYRYWRYYAADGSFCSLAELYFYEKDSIQSTIADIIGTEGSFRTDGRHTRAAAFDRDLTTFFDAPCVDDAWVGMDFGRPVSLDRIVYVHRSDGNCIEIGDHYELYYWDNHRWNSLGKRVGDGAVLRFDNCPRNALFLLRDHTKGTEERPFTYEDGKQVWW